MEEDSRDAGALPPDSSVGPFVIRQLVASANHERLYEASDPRLERNVLVRVAEGDTATAFAADARRIAAVTHPNLVAVLAASTFDGGAFAAMPDLKARSLREVIATGRLASGQVAKIGRGVAAASEALAAANLRVPVDLDTVIVTADSEGERGLLDPLRATPDTSSRLADADPAGSARELADLLDSIVHEPSEALRRAIDETRSGVLARPRDLAEALSAIAPPVPTAPRRRNVVAAGALALVAAIAMVALVLATRGDDHPAASAAVPAARVVARIPLGLSGGERALAFAIYHETAWITTSQGRLLRVDARSNQIVGSGLRLGPERAQLGGIESSNGSLWVTGDDFYLLRLDPRTGHITSRFDFSTTDHFPIAARPANGILWIPGSDGTSGTDWRMVRFDPVRMRAIGVSVPIPSLPFLSAASGKNAWAVSLVTGELERVDASGAHESRFVTAAPTGIALDGRTLWVSDGALRIVTPVDAVGMRLTREAIQTGGFAVDVVPYGPDIWVTTSTGQRGSGTQAVERFDSRTGRRAGLSVPVSHEAAMKVGLGSVWVLSDNALTRLAPTTPRPALAPARPAPSSPRQLETGPLPGGTWAANRLVAPFTIAVPAYAWVESGTPGDSPSITMANRPDVSVSVTELRHVFVTYSNLVAVHGPAQLLALLRRNQHVAVSGVHKTTFDGHAAIELTTAVRNPQINFGACGPTPCVPLFSVPGGQMVLVGGTIGPMFVVEIHGHLLGISVNAKSGDERGLALALAVARTIHFAR